MFAYVPARGGSRRVPGKNVRPLGGRPVLVHVLDSLERADVFSGIALSSDDPGVLGLAGDRPGVVTLAPRDPALADSATTFVDLLRHDVPRFAEHFADRDVLLVIPTAALVPAATYAQVVRQFRERGDGVVLGVRRYEESPLLALTGEPDALEPAFPEMYSRPTAELPGCYLDAGCFYGLSLDALGSAERLVDLRPLRGIVLPRHIAIDVDTEDDWRTLEAAFDRHVRERSRDEP